MKDPKKQLKCGEKCKQKPLSKGQKKWANKLGKKKFKKGKGKQPKLSALDQELAAMDEVKRSAVHF